ncbi:MAG: NAD(P)-dependent oxidoreductase, partial [Alphaproteobacteria bacterium]
MPEKLRVGIAGCGAMGLPMAINLQKADFRVKGYDVRPLDEFGDFASHLVKSAAELAKTCPVVISVVRDWHQTEVLCFGENGLFSGETNPEILVISSTLSPRQMLELRGRIPVDTALVDAPMSGAPIGAENATLTFMIGGEALEVDTLMPVFRAMGKEINHLGDLGAGMTCKVLNN